MPALRPHAAERFAHRFGRRDVRGGPESAAPGRVLSAAARNAVDRATMRLRIGYLPDCLPEGLARNADHGGEHPARGDRARDRLGGAPGRGRACSAARRCGRGPSRPHQRAPHRLGRPRAPGGGSACDSRTRDEPGHLPGASRPGTAGGSSAGRQPRLPQRHRFDLPRRGCRPRSWRWPSRAWSTRCWRWLSGAGLALLPESAAERYTAPGVRFVPVEGIDAAFESVVITHRDSEDAGPRRHSCARCTRQRPHRRPGVATRPVASGLARFSTKCPAGGTMPTKEDGDPAQCCSFGNWRGRRQLTPAAGIWHGSGSRPSLRRTRCEDRDAGRPRGKGLSPVPAWEEGEEVDPAARQAFELGNYPRSGGATR